MTDTTAGVPLETGLGVARDVRRMIVPDWLHRRSQTHGHCVAVDNAGVQMSFHDLAVQASRIANAMAEFEVMPGDRVAVLVEAGWRFAAVVHGVMARRAILVPVNRRLSAVEVAWQLQDAQASCLVYDPPCAEQAAQILRHENSSGVRSLSWEEVYDANQTELASEIDLDAPHAIVYTSGTTGVPKGAVLTYGNHWWGAVGSALQLGLHDGDHWLSPMPLFHVGGLAVLMRSLIYGSTAVLQDRFVADRANEALDSGRINLVSLAPAMLQQMIGSRTHGYPDALRCALIGGSALPRPLLQRALLLGIPVAPSYGLTETNSQAATLLPSEVGSRGGSSGRPLLPTEIRVVCGERVGEAGEAGEIQVRGPSVTVGYWQRPTATSAALQDGWFATGDIGQIDENGYLYVFDRRTDLIVSGAENVYPAEVEAVLLGHPGVADACVVGVAHERWGQVPVAFVVIRQDDAQFLAEKELLSYCRQRLAGYKVPVDVRYVPSLPRNAAGKVQRRMVRAWLES